MNQKQRLDFAHWVINLAKRFGADDAKVRLSREREVEVEYRDNDLEKLTESTQSSLSVSLYVEHKYSAHSTSDLTKDSVEKFIENAVEMTKYLTPDPFRELPEPALYANRPEMDLQLYDARQKEIETPARIKLAREVERAAQAQSDKILSCTTSYSDGEGESTVLTSNGFEGNRQSSYFSLGAKVTVQGENGARPEDYYYIATRFHDDLLDAEQIGKLAAKRALAKIGMKKISSRKCTMLVENRTGGRLISALLGPLSGHVLQQKQSFLEGMLNQQITSEKLTLIDDPFILKGLSSRLYDGEGISARKMPVIENGILKTYYIDTYYGKKLNMAPTFGSQSNLIFQPGQRNLEEMIANVQSGILITGFLGGNTNSTTGDFSLGLQGVLIENGQRIHPVNEMNISGHLKALFLSLAEVGSDPYLYSSVQTPTLRFEGVDFSGI